MCQQGCINTAHRPTGTSVVTSGEQGSAHHTPAHTCSGGCAAVTSVPGTSCVLPTCKWDGSVVEKSERNTCHGHVAGFEFTHACSFSRGGGMQGTKAVTANQLSATKPTCCPYLQFLTLLRLQVLACGSAVSATAWDTLRCTSCLETCTAACAALTSSKAVLHQLATGLTH